ncbi:AraC family transcriptional regulator [Epilithonimonas sp. JDS]|uniref:helix-turn-helix domain-containing protein n=1 Tax=Epilithonimonas sp. JDS TaxID=2902797 RepID=UPI001E5CF68E|nr:AraC family transcriptional regulator [Epilithonimonas sp. JDS]MCD9856225.1 AraC family transcriptional regulator [Epilithonimonas sp. JDS]
MDEELKYRLIKPDQSIADFVYCFSSLQNLSTQKEGIVIPNGKIDLLFYKTRDNQLQIVLMGLETRPKPTPKLDITSFFSISFNPLALEYILHQSIAELVNSGMALPNDFWDFNIDDLDDFEIFCEKASTKIHSLLPKEIDERKLKLFNLIFETDGEINIKELSEKIVWEERQINRYFKKHLGISLKYYCNILRFQASLFHIKDGNLYPQLNFTDQSHFIKEIKKLSGVSPKELFKNQNDRFLQFLVYHTK